MEENSGTGPGSGDDHHQSMARLRAFCDSASGRHIHDNAPSLSPSSLYGQGAVLSKPQRVKGLYRFGTELNLLPNVVSTGLGVEFNRFVCLVGPRDTAPTNVDFEGALGICAGAVHELLCGFPLCRAQGAVLCALWWV